MQGFAAQSEITARLHFSFPSWWGKGRGWGDKKMARKGQRILVKMRSTESGHIYITEKSRRNTQGRLELRKYDPYLRKHVVYRETK